MNADPKRFENAQKLSSINYNQAIELAYYGASVIHPKTIQPLKSKNISLYVNSFINMDDEGTVVNNQAENLNQACYIVKEKQTQLSFSTKNYSFIAEDNLSYIFEAFAKHKVRINVMQNSAISFSACCDTKENKIDDLMNDLKEYFIIDSIPECVLLTVYNSTQNEELPAIYQNKSVLLKQFLGHTIQMVLK
jgi:aspartate kinase